MTVYSIKESRHNEDQVVNHGMLRTLIDPIDIKYTCLHALRPEASRGETTSTTKQTNNLSIYHCIDGMKGRSIIRKNVDKKPNQIPSIHRPPPTIHRQQQP
jgi:hypothetical protein